MSWHPDALVLLSFGGPEGPDDVMPFLRRVTAGRGVPDARLATVARHYLARGGHSPINGQNRALIAALSDQLEAEGRQVPVLWGNRNWHPFLTDAFTEALDRGLHRLQVITTSAYPSASGCRQYGENIAAALAEVDPGGLLQVRKVRPYYAAGGFVDATTAAVARALAMVRDRPETRVRLLWVTHSIPVAMQEASRRRNARGYVEAHTWLADRILSALGEAAPPAELVYCSRSGRPGQPWLEPDVVDRLEELAVAPDRPDAVVLAPIGFVSDHMEVIQDLDTEALGAARRLGLACVRADTVGTDPAFVRALVDLALQPGDACPDDCCEVLDDRFRGPAAGDRRGRGRRGGTADPRRTPH